ncbi:MAG: LacI family DNA-binding transcriptional regulator, partial [Actinocrinis sp.]
MSTGPGPGEPTDSARPDSAYSIPADAAAGGAATDPMATDPVVIDAASTSATAEPMPAAGSALAAAPSAVPSAHAAAVGTAGPSEPSRPTLREVAELSGVSLKTASRVFNGEQYVAPETAARVRTAAVQLGFRPNTIARELRAGARSALVGLIIGDVANPFYARIARGAER